MINSISLCTVYLRWEELAHWIVYPLAECVLVLSVLCEVLHHLLAVTPELVVEDPVREADGEQQGEDVQGLQEEEVPLIT